MSWTDERVETLKSMWSEGKSASQIAKELGGVTRNAVIGKVHRLGLSNRVGGEAEDAAGAPEPAADEAREPVADAAPQPAAAPARPAGQGAGPGGAPEARARPADAAAGHRPRRSAPRRWPTSPRSPRRPAASA